MPLPLNSHGSLENPELFGPLMAPSFLAPIDILHVKNLNKQITTYRTQNSMPGITFNVDTELTKNKDYIRQLSEDTFSYPAGQQKDAKRQTLEEGYENNIDLEKDIMSNETTVERNVKENFEKTFNKLLDVFEYDPQGTERV